MKNDFLYDMDVFVVVSVLLYQLGSPILFYFFLCKIMFLK